MHFVTYFCVGGAYCLGCVVVIEVGLSRFVQSCAPAHARRGGVLLRQWHRSLFRRRRTRFRFQVRRFRWSYRRARVGLAESGRQNVFNIGHTLTCSLLFIQIRNIQLFVCLNIKIYINSYNFVRILQNTRNMLNIPQLVKYSQLCNRKHFFGELCVKSSTFVYSHKTA